MRKYNGFLILTRHQFYTWTNSLSTHQRTLAHFLNNDCNMLTLKASALLFYFILFFEDNLSNKLVFTPNRPKKCKIKQNKCRQHNVYGNSGTDAIIWPRFCCRLVIKPLLQALDIYSKRGERGGKKN